MGSIFLLCNRQISFRPVMDERHPQRGKAQSNTNAQEAMPGVAFAETISSTKDVGVSVQESEEDDVYNCQIQRK